MQREQQDVPIDVKCRSAPDGWTCTVSVGGDADGSQHEVEVTRDELELLVPGATDATPLVEASFRYLLEREPRESILPRFSIRTIASYFPSYPEEIRARL